MLAEPTWMGGGYKYPPTASQSLWRSVPRPRQQAGQAHVQQQAREGQGGPRRDVQRAQDEGGGGGADVWPGPRVHSAFPRRGGPAGILRGCAKKAVGETSVAADRDGVVGGSNPTPTGRALNEGGPTQTPPQLKSPAHQGMLEGNNPYAPCTVSGNRLIPLTRGTRGPRGEGQEIQKSGRRVFQKKSWHFTSECGPPLALIPPLVHPPTHPPRWPN